MALPPFGLYPPLSHLAYGQASAQKAEALSSFLALARLGRLHSLVGSTLLALDDSGFHPARDGGEKLRRALASDLAHFMNVGSLKLFWQLFEDASPIDSGETAAK